jgi:hypothetical protein
MRVADLNLADSDQLQLKGVEIAGYKEGDTVAMTFTVVQVELGSASLRGVLKMTPAPEVPVIEDPAPVPPAAETIAHKGKK